MGLWQPVTRLKDYVSHNPPVFTFFLGLLTLAMSFICLGFYSHTYTLPNPDSVKDWNHLLSSLSQLQLCEKENESFSEINSSIPYPLVKQKNESSLPVTQDPSFISILHLWVPVDVTIRPPSEPPQDLRLHTMLSASLLNIGGEDNVSLTFEVPVGNSTHTCLTISAPTHLLPMSLLPPVCSASETNISLIHMEATEQPQTESQTCFSLHFKTDPTLTVMLTQEEQSMSERHLFEVGVFLLVSCIVLCLSVSLTHSLTQHQDWKELDLQNEPLIES